MTETLIEPIRQEKEYKELLREALAQSNSRKPYPVMLTGLSEGAGCAFYAAVSDDWSRKRGGKTLIIVSDESSAYLILKIFNELGKKAEVFPYRDFGYSKISASHSYEHERLSVLDKAINGGAEVFITTPDAALQYTIPRERLKKLSLTIKTGEEISLDELTEKLELLGYRRADLVEGEGQYSVRGGICDIFPPKYESPVRIEFFGDEIDRLAEFDIISQRTVKMLDCLSLTPGREVVLSKADSEKLLGVIGTEIQKAGSEKALEELREEYETVETGKEAAFIDKYISVIYEEKECLLDYFGKDTLVLIKELNAVKDRLKGYAFQLKESEEALLRDSLILGAYADYGKWPEYFDDFCGGRATVFCNTFTSDADRLAGLYNIKSKQGVSYRDNLELLREDIEHYIELGYRINILAENEVSARNLSGMLLDENTASTLNSEPKPGIPNIVSGVNFPPFELTLSKYVCISLFPSVYSPGGGVRGTRKRKSKKSARERISSYAELEIGDYVVHENHGIGRYLGLSTVTVGEVTNDYVKIAYDGDGFLYLPCTQLDMLSKYVGAGTETGTVKLSKLGGSEWGKAKLRAKAAAKEMAKELISLYAERMRREGISFDEDDAMQQEFEGAFEFEETEGQLEASREIKDDMERPVPMERLLCGDVGYGKTEVALRAAFKAVRSGYQVAILVPTTILALQHYQTVLARMRGFPVTVDMVSRFRKGSELKDATKKLKRGETDIIIGTHRLLSKDIEFKKLGLVIIDEEQRFGVAQKEKLKQLVRDVDVLTLSATPIPRTLNMAMSGIRDMSVLEEPPVNRVPVQTFVLEYDEAIIAEAVRKELRRGGQVFYLHNRIETLSEIAARISAYAPEASVAVAHGQMDREELSDIWKQMLDGEINVLVCTTLIESGVDIPNANTLIIDDAERYGLSQLHQLRGRVGRSGRRAYAYLTYRRGTVLSEVAEKRLTAIRDFTEFGSGFRVAMRDMEIRGAGNLLGSQQHGQIESVGYDLYMKLLSEAVLEEKGEMVKQKKECAVSMGTDAFIPEKYIRSVSQRIDVYKKIASVENEEDLRDVYDELTDRYGTPPKQAEALLRISLIREMGGVAGFDKIEYSNGGLMFYIGQFEFEKWQVLLSEYKSKLTISAGAPPYARLKIDPSSDRIEEALSLLKKYIQITGQKTVDRV